MLYIYNRQNKCNYVFAKEQYEPYIYLFYNQWKWFYKGNEHIKRIDITKQTNNMDKNSLRYRQGLLSFINNYIKEDIDKELKSNIIQAYVLQVHNFYKNKFMLELNKWKSILTQSTAIYIMLSVLYILIIQT